MPALSANAEENLAASLSGGRTRIDLADKMGNDSQRILSECVGKFVIEAE
jgi:hypothetical protein